MKCYKKYSTPLATALAIAALERIRQLEALYGSRCAACGDPLPEDPERFELARGRYYCARCGCEWGDDV